MTTMTCLSLKTNQIFEVASAAAVEQVKSVQKRQAPEVSEIQNDWSGWIVRWLLRGATLDIFSIHLEILLVNTI